MLTGRWDAVIAQFQLVDQNVATSLFTSPSVRKWQARFAGVASILLQHAPSTLEETLTIDAANYRLATVDDIALLVRAVASDCAADSISQFKMFITQSVGFALGIAKKSYSICQMLITMLQTGDLVFGPAHNSPPASQNSPPVFYSMLLILQAFSRMHALRERAAALDDGSNRDTHPQLETAVWRSHVAPKMLQQGAFPRDAHEAISNWAVSSTRGA